MDWGRRVGLLAVLVASLVLGGCSSGDKPPAPPAGSSSSSPTTALGENTRFYVPPNGNAQKAVKALRRAGKTDAARLVERRIASRPTAIWLTDVSGSVYNQAKKVTDAAAAKKELPVLVAYNLPGRDCGLYSSGGAADVDAYLHYVGSLAAGIGGNPAVVILEPDAIAHSLEGCHGSRAAERYRMLTEAVTILKRQPKVRVYIDAGNASWIKNLDGLANALKRSGIRKADGFALNVSNFETTDSSVGYGRQLSQRLDGAHFVIDTSRNGAGPPPPASDPSSHSNWCNPKGRRLGTPATTDTGNSLVDAFLWIKQPGDSDGSCGRGAPPAGHWWPRYASELLGGTPS
jgi:endoglucanase